MSPGTQNRALWGDRASLATLVTIIVGPGVRLQPEIKWTAERFVTANANTP